MVNVSRTSAVELAQRIKQGEISPVEVLDAHLKTIATQNPKINAIVTLAEDEARSAAKVADAAVPDGEALGPLHGLPVVIKDVTLPASMRTTYGSSLYKSLVPVEDAAVVARLRRVGAIIHHARIRHRSEYGRRAIRGVRN